MASIQLCILLWIFFTQTISSLTASPCSCNGFISNDGKGECGTRHNEKLWCYVNPQAVCSDKKESKSIRGKSWSFQACQENIASVSGNDDDQQNIISEDCSCNGFISSEGKGECGTKHNKKLWCYVNSQAGCDDKKESKAIVGQSWSFQACQVQENIGSVSGNDNAHLTILDVDENGNVRCEDEGDCPDYDKNTMRNILGLTEEWNPYMSCMVPDPNEDDIKYRICILQYGYMEEMSLKATLSSRWKKCPSRPNCWCIGDRVKWCTHTGGGRPVQVTSPTTGQGILPSPSGTCPSGYCRRVFRCCNYVWNGRYYICPWRC